MRLPHIAAIGLIAAAPAFADTTVVVDFETVTGYNAFLEEFYSGGTDSAGISGPNLGVAFGPDAMGIVNDALGPYFSNAPSPVGVLFPVGESATMTVAQGFVGEIGFAYSSPALVLAAVNVYSGLNGTGTLLASFNLLPTAQLGCNDAPWCRFEVQTSSFFGTAHSVTFGGLGVINGHDYGSAVGTAAFDNITITAVPEPASALMLALGAAGVYVARRRRG